MTLRHILILICFSISSLSADWTNWRGPHFNLTTAHQDFPNEFSGSKNVAWAADLPGEGASTPAIWKNTIYVTTLDANVNTVIAFDKKGNRKWETQISIGEGGSHRAGTGANPSPVVDESGVYVYFKSATLAKLDHSGKELWKRELQKDYSLTSQWWDLGTSPVLVDGKIIVAVMQQLARRRSGEKCETYVVAFDQKTGKEAWKVDRYLAAPVESNDAYTTPLVATVDGEKQLVIWGADQLTGHSIANGNLIWQCKDFNPNDAGNWHTIASHAIQDDIAVVPYGRGYAVAGIKMSGKGDITQGSRLWEIQRIGPDVPTPVIMGDTAIILTDRGALTAVDIRSGDVRWKGELPRSPDRFYSSPIVSGNRLICSREDGTVFVTEISESGMKLLAENNFDGETILATPIPHEDRLYVRTSSRLYCIGNKS